MRKQLWGAAAVAIVWTGDAAAVHTEKYQIPYFGIAYEHLVTDNARLSDDGQGFQLTFGVPLESANKAIELRVFDSGFERDIDGKKDYQTGLFFVDYVHDFGELGGAGSAGLFGSIKPFVTLGAGLIEEDVRGDKHLHFGLNAGAGLLVPLPFNGWAVRLDGRIQPQSNSESCSSTSVCSKEKDYLVDYQVNLGLQIPITWFFDRPVEVPAEECPIAVVDPETGRRDCVVDSDGDGVGDPSDACPGTPAGTPVDKRGCPKVKVSNDDDNDGVPNDRDQCPDTQAGLKVDDTGCVVAQRTAIAGVTFQPNAAKLTAEGRQTLDGIAETLKQQEDLKAEIAGHTDAVGSEAYNTLLSQQRADAVRAYLVEKGIEASRLTAVGYGELEPVASNDTEEGRRQNRRVEFRITSD